MNPLDQNLSNDKRKVILKGAWKNLLKALTWFCINFFFAAAPFGGLYVLQLFITKPEVIEAAKITISNLHKECALSFVSCALIGAIMVDFLHSKAKIGKRFSFALGGLTLLPLTFVMIPFVAAVINHDEMSAKDYRTLVGLQYFMVIYAAAYCTIVKTILFIRESEEQLKEQKI